MTAFIDISGRVFGRWTVICKSDGVAWWCKCACGTERAVNGGSLRSNRTNGCIKCHPGIGNRKTHGQNKTRLHTIWVNMRRRCTSSSDAAYFRYGARGIVVCHEWQKSFEAFCAWAMKSGYAPDLTIDRIDNDKGYSPENCRWVTPRDQNRNRRDNRRIEFRGEMLLASEIAERHGLPADVVKNRIWRYGWPVEMAATTPVQPKGGKRALTFTAVQRNIDAKETP